MAVEEGRRRTSLFRPHSCHRCRTRTDLRHNPTIPDQRPSHADLPFLDPRGVEARSLEERPNKSRRAACLMCRTKLREAQDVEEGL